MADPRTCEVGATLALKTAAMLYNNIISAFKMRILIKA
jgi:hypothetical protein